MPKKENIETKKAETEAQKPGLEAAPSTDPLVLWGFSDEVSVALSGSCISDLVPNTPSSNPVAGPVVSPPPTDTAISFEYVPGAQPFPARTLK